MKKDEAAKIFGVTEKSMKHFKVQDPFNPWELEGYINCSNMFYGSMIIFKINDYLTEQVIVSTPKQKYPFDRLGRFKFPSSKHINVYEKLDGTNILAYGYKIKGRVYVTYKTRLNPILNQSRWGDWKKMMDEMLLKYSKLPNFAEELILNGINPSFELWGSRNKHLVEYTTPLDISFLFGIRNDVSAFSIIDPEDLQLEYSKHHISCARLEASIGKSQDLYSWYQKLRNEQEAMNSFTEDDESIKGGEGFVWYLNDINNIMHQYKCLDGRTTIETDKGNFPLYFLVTNKKPFKVKTILQNGKIGWKKIIGWHRESLDKEMFRVSFNYRKNRNGVNATEDHQFLTNNGFVAVKDLNKDSLIITGNYVPNSIQNSIISGTLLGDATIDGGRLRFGQVDVEYSKFKEHLLTSLGAKGKLSKTRIGRDYWAVTLLTAPWSKREKRRWYSGKKKIVPRDLILDELMMAIWFMDDGSLCRSNQNIEHDSPYIIIACSSFSYDDREFLRESLRRNGIETQNDKSNIRMNTENTRLFLTKIGKYVHSSMRRKVDKLTPVFKKIRMGEPKLETDKPNICKIKINKFMKYVYCIDVEDTHNFITYGGVVHNCKPPSVEDVHWASTGISKYSIMTTVINCYEETDDVTYEKVKELLSEEFDERRIDLVKEVVLRVMADVKYRINFRDRVLKLYSEMNLNLIENKTETMRTLSRFFEKNEMSKVYTALTREIEKEAI